LSTWGEIFKRGNNFFITLVIGELGTLPPNPSNIIGRLGLVIGAIEVANPPSFSACGTLMDYLYVQS
jgi:hypothetical protein